MRYVFIDLSSDNHLQHPQIFGGYAGEHNETVLQVKLPDRIISTEYSGYRFDFQTSEDNKISSPIITELQDGVLSFSLSEQFTVAGNLLFNVSAILSNGDSVSLISKTNLVTLYIGDSADGNIVLLDTTGYKDEILALIDARILEINPAKVDQSYKATSENAQSGKAVAAAISATAPSISKTVCGVRTITINDVSPIEHNLIVKVDNTANLLPYPYGNLPENGTIISEGVTYADNGDGTITMSSTDGATSSDVGLNLGTVSLTPGITYYTYHEYIEGYDSEFIHMQFVYRDGAGNYKFVDQVTWDDSYTLMGIKLYLETGYGTNTTLIPVVSITPKSTTYANMNLSDITVTVTDINGNVQSATPNRSGFVEGLKSMSPSMTISADYVVVIECTYNADTKKYIDSNGSSGVAGENGATFTPYVSEDGILSWTNDKGLNNPESVNIKGDTGSSGVYRGTEPPTDESINVWIDTTVDNDFIESIDLKQDKLVSGENIKTINGQSLLGEGDIAIEGGNGNSIEVDQVYDPVSDNAQSGKAIAEAIANIPNGHMYYYGNILPIEKCQDSYSAVGVTVTHENGVFTFNGTSTSPFSFELVTRGPHYFTFEKDVKYYICLPHVSGEIDGNKVSILLNTNTENVATSSLEKLTRTFTDDKEITRIALNIGTGTTFTDYKVAPFVGTSYNDDYAGSIWIDDTESIFNLQKDVAQLQEDVATLQEGGTVEAVDTIKYTKQELTEEQKAQARENIGAVEDICIIDYSGNILPFESCQDSYSAVGVTVTHENGVFTLNGTASSGYSLELIPRGTVYATLNANETYTFGLVPVSGEKTGNLNMFINTDSGSVWQGNLVKNDRTFTEDKILTRFALCLDNGVTYNDYKVAPYIGQNLVDGYAGGVKKKFIPASEESVTQLDAKVSTLEESVTQLDANVQIFPTMFTDEKNRVIPIVQNNTADLRLVTFADSHSFEANKYKKYNDLLSSGCIDGILGLGDYNSYSTSTRDKTLSDITQMLSHSGRTPNCFYVVGNHDIAFKSSNSGAVTQDNVLTKKEMYDCTCRHLNGVAHYNDSDPYGCYYYVDYTAAKIRMVIINTSDIYESDGSLQYKYTESVMIQQPQVTWFAEKALDFSDKDNANEWSVLVCSHSMMIYSIFSDILLAAKNGSSIDKTWTLKRRLMEGTTTVDQDNPVTITVNKDYSSQGAIDVIGVLFGHDHHDTNIDNNGIKYIGFICDNSNLDNYYITDVNGLTAGGYYITAKNGNKFAFTLTDEISNATVIGYNEYLSATAGTSVRIQGADGVTIKEIRATTAAYAEGMTRITGFVQERIANTIATESCTIVSIDKDAREIRIVPYGIGENRVFSY